MRVMKRMIVALSATALAGVLLMLPTFPKPVHVVQPTSPKGDRLVMVCIFDGPTGRICLEPMTRYEAGLYRDAEPDVYEYGTLEYAEALAEIRLEEAFTETPSEGFRMNPATVEALMKRAEHFSKAELNYP